MMYTCAYMCNTYPLSDTNARTQTHAHKRTCKREHTYTHKENIEQPRAMEREDQETDQIAATRTLLDSIENIQQHQQLTLAGLMCISHLV